MSDGCERRERARADPLAHPVFLRPPRRVTANSTWRAHIPFGMLAVELVRPRVLVELGTHLGDSYCAFCQAVDELASDTRCYAVDHWRGDPQTEFYGPEVLAELRAHHDPLYGRFSRLVESEFDAALELFSDGSIDLLHIDGCHEYDAVRHDFDSWLPKLSERGVVLLHDTNYRASGFDVWRLWEELRREYDGFSFLHSHGLGVLAVGESVPDGLARFLGHAHERPAQVRALFASLGEAIVLRAELERERGRVGEQHAHAERLERELAEDRSIIAALEAERQRLLESRGRLEREVEALRAALRDTGEEEERVRGRLHDAERAQRHLEELLRTRTFRYSRPARSVYGRLRQAAIARSRDGADGNGWRPDFDPRRLLPGSPRRVLVVSPDLLPLPGLPTVGSGLRAWALGQGLLSAGHDVVFSMPRAALDRFRDTVPAGVYDVGWELHGVADVVARTRPDVVLVSGWPNVGQLAEDASHGVPLVVDQHGPHMLERELQQYGRLDRNADEKLAALRRADFFTCAGDRQLAYFRVWLQLAGWSEVDRAERTAAIPVSLSPNLPARNPRLEPTFVFGGVFLPWQDPSSALRTLVSELDRRGIGRLEVFGGRHPWLPMPTGVFGALVRELDEHPQVAVRELVAHDALVAAYLRAHVAVDLMRRNAERELAFTTRTVEYLWCGLPVIYNDYAELAEYIDEYDAGWTLDPDDDEALRAVLDEIFEHPRRVREKAHNARRLVRERLTWDVTVAPLDAFMRAPALRGAQAATAAGGVGAGAAPAR